MPIADKADTLIIKIITGVRNIMKPEMIIMGYVFLLIAIFSNYRQILIEARLN